MQFEKFGLNNIRKGEYANKYLIKYRLSNEVNENGNVWNELCITDYQYEYHLKFDENVKNRKFLVIYLFGTNKLGFNNI